MTIAVSNHVGAEHPALAAANLTISNRTSVSKVTSLSVAAKRNNKQQKQRRNEVAGPFEMDKDHASRLGHDVAVAHLERLFSKQVIGGSSPPPGGDPFGRLPARVAYQGSRGSYCQEVAVRAFPSSSAAATLLPCFHMEDAFTALEDLTADRAVIPFENSLDGPIDRNLDLLLRHPSVRILAELVVPVNHCLLSLPGASKSSLRRVVSHPQVLSHCRRSLEALDLEVDEVASTADAALFVAENQVSDTAVIGSRIAEREFGLQVLDPNFQDRQMGGNSNRFFELGLSTAAEKASPAPAKKKTTLAFALDGGPSDLFSAMWIFERHGVRVARVDHRPHRESPLRMVDWAEGKVAYFDYVFVMDVEGSASDAAVEDAIARLTEIAVFTRVLGSYSCTCHSH